MTGRGKAAAPLQRPVTPTDPTLSTRKVPSKRTFAPTSFGPAASSDTYNTFIRTRELKERSASMPSTGKYQYEPVVLDGVTYDPMPSNDIVRLLEEIESLEAVSYRPDEAPIQCNPSWGFCLFLTSYDAATGEWLEAAMQNLVEVTRRCLYISTRVVFAEEAFKRLQFQVVHDEEKLSDASEDRVRAEFRALVRGLGIAEDDVVPPPARNLACLILDEESIAMLAGLEFPESFENDSKKFEKKTLKVIDVQWNRPERSATSYRGKGNIQITNLARLYLELTCDRLMEELHLWEEAPRHLAMFG